ncbi:hypothetical protein HUJ04_000401 [Dendroctonus ponderosae]|nr:hypothetical protein HUJ04_000401 [Dendroctonus ponderosae]KAH1019131.1 hypothetical protein HUJ05_006779 [Dendroctonus ponderosae]
MAAFRAHRGKAEATRLSLQRPVDPERNENRKTSFEITFPSPAFYRGGVTIPTTQNRTLQVLSWPKVAALQNLSAMVLKYLSGKQLSSTATATNRPLVSPNQSLSHKPTTARRVVFWPLHEHELKPEISSKEPTVTQISEIVAVRIRDIWEKATIPTVIHERILQMIRAYHNKHRNLMKSYKERQADENYKEKINIFQESSKRLFDVCSCKCNLGNCTCEKNRRISKSEIDFLMDQKTETKIGCID